MPLSFVMKEKLRQALSAQRVAVVGASQEQLSVGIGPLHNLLSHSFRGEIFPVNPKYDWLLGRKCYPTLESIHPPPDLAILLLNQHSSLAMTERAALHGVKAVSIVAGGFKEIRAEGAELEEKLRELAFRHQLPVIGPNTLGFSNLGLGLHGIFWHLETFPGPTAILTQSGGVGLTMGYALRSLGTGLSYFIGVGNASVVDVPDYLEILEEDPNVRCFTLFLEGLQNPRLFFETARRVCIHKPIVAYKAGKHEEVSKATQTHTGNLTGDYRLYRAMMKQAGIFEAATIQEAAAASKALGMLPVPRGDRLCALTFTAGPTIVAMDKLLPAGWRFPDLSAETLGRVQSIIGEATPVRLRNPVDLTGPGFLPQTYIRVLKTLLEDSAFDAYFIVWNYNPLIRVPVVEMESLLHASSKPVVMAFLANQRESARTMDDLAARGICATPAPEDGALALNALLSRSRFLRRAGVQSGVPEQS